MESNKFIPTAYRILFLMSLLQKNNLSLKEIEEEFLKNPNIDKELRRETFLKYIKTLNNSGIIIEKEKNKYILKDFLIKLNLSDRSIKTLIKLQKYINGLYQHNLTLNYGKFIYHLSKYLDKEKNRKIKELKKNNKEIFKEYLRYKDILTTMDAYIQKGRKLEISTIFSEKIILDSAAIDYYDKNIYLSGYNQKTKELTSIPAEIIQKISLSSQVSRKINLYPSVTFKLKGKLAQNYKLKSNEKIYSFDEEKKELTVINTKEDKELLFRRLIRYGLLCEILEPKYVRKEFKDFISKMLENYQ